MTFTELLFPFEHFGAAHLATVLIGLVCAYLGTFLVMRRMVFVGITVGELAALGIAFAYRSFSMVPEDSAFGHLWHEYGAVVGALAFGIAGVAIFGSPPRNEKTSPDAMLGVGYATGAAFALILVSASAQGLEELKNVLAGSVLFVSDARLTLIAVVLAGITAIHVAFRKEFLFSSFDPDMARTVGVPARVYDKLLDVTVGITIAVAIQSAGLLLVFGFLVLPALAGFALGRSLAMATGLAMATALVASTAGLHLSAVQDWAIGPSVVACLFVVLMVGWTVSGRPRPSKVASWLIVAMAGICLVPLAIALGNVLLHTHMFEPHSVHVEHSSRAEEDAIEAAGPDIVAHDPVVRRRAVPGPLPDVKEIRRSLRSPNAQVRAGALNLLVRLREKDAFRDVVTALGDTDEGVREVAVDTLGAIGDERAIPWLENLTGAEDETLRLHVALAFLRLGEPRGAKLLIDILTSADFPFTRDEALTALVAVAGDGGTRGYDTDLESADNAGALEAWASWWQTRGPGLTPQALARPFAQEKDQ